MSLSYDRLSDEEIAKRLSALPGWSFEDGFLTRLFEFDSYLAGVVFANHVAYVAEDLNHHPDITIGYKTVRVSVHTHAASGGLTAYDFELAHRLS